MKKLSFLLLRRQIKQLTGRNICREFTLGSNFGTKDRLKSADLLQVSGEDRSNKFNKSRNELYKKKTVIEVNGEVLFGINPIKMALDTKRRTFYQMFLQKSATPVSPRLVDLELQANKLGIPVTKFPKSALDKLSEGRLHQGACLDVSPLTAKPFDLTLEPQDGIGKERKLWILLDKVHDPMNLGAILRSSYYFGIDKLIVTRSSCPLTPVVSKASSGVMELLPVYQNDDPVQLLLSKALEGWSVYGTASQDAAGESDNIMTNLVRLRDIVWPKSTVLVIGGEGSGISKELVQYCQKFVYISTDVDIHPFLQSLNVSVATGYYIWYTIF
ncbi:Ribose methyltransferase, variant 2 [Chamberlinius hualienensis]